LVLRRLLLPVVRTGGVGYGRPISVLGEAIISVQLLTWDEGDRDPEWINIDERVLPPIAVEKLAELVEEQVVEQEAEHLKNLS